MLHAGVDLKYYTKPIIYFRWEKVELRFHLFIRFIIMSIAYTGIYQCILLPFSGLGIIEWFFVACLLALMLFNYKTCPKTMVVSSPETLLFFQVCLFFVKLFTWIAPENVYRELIEGNDTARWIIAIIFATFLISGLLALRRKVLPITDEQGNNIKKIGKKILRFFIKVITLIKNFILSLAYGPIIILIIAGVSVLLFGLGVFKIKDDLLKFIEPVLRGILSTGKYQVQETPIYIFAQLGTIVLYGLYQFLIVPIEIKDDTIFDCIEDEIEEEIKELPLSQQTEMLENFKDLYKKNKTEVLYNINAYKEKCFKELKLNMKDNEIHE